jgi:mannose/fructose/N-acetylgalactosamine-specific phosphotransferase system component IID
VLDKLQTQQLAMAMTLFLVLLHQQKAGKVLVIFRQQVAVLVKMVVQAAAVDQQLAQEQLERVIMAVQVLALHLLAAVVEKVVLGVTFQVVSAALAEHHQTAL